MCNVDPVKVSVTGASGLIGDALAKSLRADGHQVTAVRREDARFVTDDLRDADAVVHLAGESIGGKLRWNAEHKRKVMRSRQEGTRQIAEFLASREGPPASLLSASAVGYYGSDRGDEVLDETSGSGDGFLAEVCREWEAATEPAEAAGVRVVHLRTGIVLSPKGGLLPRFVTPGKFGLGAKLGSGRQWTSWISLSDEVRAIRFALDNSQITGALNLTAPNPATNAQLTAAIGRVLHRPAFMQVPAFALKSALGSEAAQETVLASQRVQPAALLRAGFIFQDPQLEPTLSQMLGS